MTKKDYKLIAEVITKFNPIMFKEHLVRDLCASFQRNNTKFDYRKFIPACYKKEVQSSE